jgi:hypothetical protein
MDSLSSSEAVRAPSVSMNKHCGNEADTQELVRQLNDNVYTVDWAVKTCSYSVFSREQHSLWLCSDNNLCPSCRGLTTYMLESLSILTWKKIYTSNSPLIDISNLQKHPSLTTTHLWLKFLPADRRKRDSEEQDTGAKGRGCCASSC